MAQFNRRGGGGFGRDQGGSRFSGQGGGRPSFSRKPWGDRSAGGRQQNMHEATCAKCGKNCEVPFRPVQGKAVYCKDCFGDRSGGGGQDRFPRKDFGNRPRAGSDFGGDRGGNDALKKQLELLNAKLDKLAEAVSNLSRSSASIEKEESPKTVVKKAAKKTVKKKA